MDRKIIHFGIRLLELKDFIGLQITQDFLLLFKRQVQGFIISLINHGGVKFLDSIGVKPNKKEKKVKSSSRDFGIKKSVIREIKLYLYLKTWKERKFNKS